MRRSLSVSLVAIVVIAIASLGATLASGNTPKLGLDLQGGASVVLAPVKGTRVSPGVLDQSIAIIRRRVDSLGVAEASINRQGNNIVVELPGVKDQNKALSIVGQTAELRFRPVLQQFPGGGTLDHPASGPSPNTSTTTAGGPTTTAPGATTTAPAASPPSSGALGTGPAVEAAGLVEAQAAPQPAGATPAPAAPAPAAPAPGSPNPATPPTPSAIPGSPGGAAPPSLTPRDQDKAQAAVVLPEVKPGTSDIISTYALGPAELTGDVVSSVDAVAPTGIGGGWIVRVHFTGAGSTKWDAMAAKYVGKQIAIVLDGLVVSAPTIQTAHFGGTADISGSSTSGGFTHGQASTLALVLRYGSLPVPLEQQTVQKVSATLGKDSLRAGLLAGIIGLALVLLYMIAYYRALGIVVVLGLSVSGALMYSIITYLGSSGLALSLSGVTGIIVSVGVTVDSYIVYFERLKDELRAGKTIRSSVDRGFARAWRTIVSADAVSFIGAALLYLLTVGPVRGFAFFLGLSTLLDLLVAYTFTRSMVVLLGRNRTFTQARFFGVARGLAAAPAGTP